MSCFVAVVRRKGRTRAASGRPTNRLKLMYPEYWNKPGILSPLGRCCGHKTLGIRVRFRFLHTAVVVVVKWSSTRDGRKPGKRARVEN